MNTGAPQATIRSEQNKKPLVDTEQVRRAFQALTTPGQVVEIRVLDAIAVDSPRYAYTASGYFNDLEALLKSLKAIRYAKGFYMTLQPCQPALLARAKNRLRSAQDMKSDKSTTTDTQILRYRWLPIDADPSRPSGISSSKEEHEAALAVIETILAELRDEGWPEAVKGDSGNGWHAVYPIDLENTPENTALIQRVLQGLAERFNVPGVSIDLTVFNPARIWKLYGTLACKGDDTPDRPHRLSRLIEVPARERVVSIAQLEAIAVQLPEARQHEQKHIPRPALGQHRQFSLDDFLAKHGIPAKAPEPYKGGVKRLLEQCPFCLEEDKSACVYELGDGSFGFHCQHNRCANLHWHDFREHFEPRYDQPRKTEQAKKKAEPQDEQTEIDEEKDESQAQMLRRLALEQATLFCTPGGERYARIERNGHYETLTINERNGAFKRWLIHRYGSITGGLIPNATALSSAISSLEAEAEFGNEPRQEVYLRIAHKDGRIYLNLANEAQEVVEIDTKGWRILEKKSPVCFRQPNGMLPLPRPERDGSLSEIVRFINVEADSDDGILMLAWLIGIFHPTGPYPILNVHGERGSAKSTTTRYFRTLIDPHQAPTRKEPEDPRTLAIMAHNNAIIALDNLSHIPSWLSDALCRLATGAGDAYRKNYTDDEEMIFSAIRPIVLNGIEEVATRGDLLDRAITINLPEIKESKRKTEREYWREAAETHPRILGAVLDAVSEALRNLPTTHADELPRMADFSLFILACEKKLTKKPGAFLEAYNRNRANAVSIELEAAPVSKTLELFMADRPSWCGLTADLHPELKKLADEDTLHAKGWPVNSRVLGGMLKRLAPSLRTTGLDIHQKRTNKGAYLTITRREECSKSVANDPDGVAKSSDSVAKKEVCYTPDGPDSSTGNLNSVASVAKMVNFSASIIPSFEEEKEEKGESNERGAKKSDNFATLATPQPKNNHRTIPDSEEYSEVI
jgi:hypothetical protein